MMRLRRLFAALLLTVAVIAPAVACSCIMPDGSRSDHVRREFKQAEYVFSAYVASVYRSEGPDSRRMVKLRVLQVWKGDLAANTWLEVESDGDSGTGCGLAVDADTAILAYTSGHALHSCSMTGRLDRATQDIPLLNKLAAGRK
ncbi:MAG TPA: hypothetical protein VM469_03905 [Pseudoxanthomonas sp.]|nr:hypothetical protein [Pseudoxanthomonas sp.]